MDKCYILGCVKDCESHLSKVFDNISIISKDFCETKIIIFYDKSEDGSLEKLVLLKETFPNLDIIINTEPVTSYRTYNIANARNKLIDRMNSDNDETFKYFIMVDMDDVFTGVVQDNVLSSCLKRDDWDALSFNRQSYYDTWAISIDPYIYSCWHFGDTHRSQYATMIKIRKYVKDILDSLDTSELLTCYSAFNGFAIYRRGMFDNCLYDGNISKSVALCHCNSHIANMEYLLNEKNTFSDPSQEQDCEHRHFHHEAIQKNNARIRISPLILITDI
jgi:hypothetical protein